MVTSAAIYARISEDRQGERLGVTRQLDDCRQLADQRGWPVAAEYVDNDVSAYSGRPRPEYARMLDDLRAGVVDAVVVWHPDRLTRSVRDLEDVIDVVESAGAEVATVTAGDVDLTTSDGRAYARIGATLARKESEDKSRRLRRKHDELAQNGRPTGGGARPYGYADDRVTVVDREAEVVREAARRVLAGEAVGRVCRDLTARGVETVTGRPWRTTTLRRVLTSPRAAGLREHRGEIIGDATWEPLLDRDTWERVRAAVLDPRRRTGGRPREYLLTGGLAICGLCGSDTKVTPLIARPRSGGQRCYICPPDDSALGFAGCGRIRCLADPLEHEVAERVFARLDGERLRTVLSEHAEAVGHRELLDELATTDERLHDLEVAHFVDGVLSRSGYLDARSQLEARAEDLRRRIARDEHARMLVDLPATVDRMRQRWAAEPIVWRSRLLAAVVDHVVVGPHGTPGRNRFDPDRVTVVWRV